MPCNPQQLLLLQQRGWSCRLLQQPLEPAQELQQLLQVGQVVAAASSLLGRGSRATRDMHGHNSSSNSMRRRWCSARGGRSCCGGSWGCWHVCKGRRATWCRQQDEREGDVAPQYQRACVGMLQHHRRTVWHHGEITGNSCPMIITVQASTPGQRPINTITSAGSQHDHPLTAAAVAPSTKQTRVWQLHSTWGTGCMVQLQGTHMSGLLPFPKCPGLSSPVKCPNLRCTPSVHGTALFRAQKEYSAGQGISQW